MKSLTKPLPVFSHATIYDGIVYVSCLQGFIPRTFKLAGSKAYQQTEQIMKNLKVILKESGSNMKKVIKMTIFFKNIKRDFESVNKIIDAYFPINPPARSSIEIKDLPKNAKIVIEFCSAVE